ncbi:hypothetical protein [Nocardioides panacisoli]|uniref:Ig-like domain-containing protein n=1 Tax=Nocardioides panacisoli TaxID=627624 RepID=A0ABP7IA00_9ACTN
MGIKGIALTAATGLIGSALGVVSAAPALADVAPLAATAAIDAPAGVSAALSGSAAVTSTAFNDFPSQGSSYLVLSTGDADQVLPALPDPQAQLSTDRGNDGAPDSSSLTLTIQPAAGIGCLFVDFALGTEEPVHTYTTDSASDTLSIKRSGDATEYAMNAGRGYFSQASWPAKPVPYSVNALDYWHAPGDPTDPVTGSTEEPRLPRLTGLNHVTTRDTARIPLTFAGGAETVTVSVSDVSNGDLDSVAFLDHLRLGASCSSGTGVEPNPAYGGGVIGGIRGVGDELWYDPIPSTSDIERYDDPAVQGNGWRSPSNVPVELRFRWYRTMAGYAHDGDMSHWSAIPDADRQSYVPTSVDAGSVLIVMVTGFVDGRRPETFPSTGTQSTWYVTLPIGNGTFVDGEAPTIVGPSGGHASVGDTLTAQIGHTVPREDTYSWQWFENGVSISGATGQSLTLGAAQAGRTITVTATAKRLNFDPKSWTSAGYGPITLQTWSSTGSPTILDDGTPTYGETLTADPGSGWAPTPDSYSYQWKRDGIVISGATNASYSIKSDDVGGSLTVTVSGVKTGYAAQPRTSEPVSVLGATMIAGTPTITGTPTVDQTLTAVSTGWNPGDATLTYAWYAGDLKLQEDSSRYLVVPAKAAGLPIVVRVTGSRTGYQPLTVASDPTPAVAKGKLTVGTPQVYGAAVVGQTLQAITGAWGPSGVRLSTQWKVGGTPVTGRAGHRESFTIPRSARGKRITFVVTGKLAGYTTVTRSTAPTSKVTR